MDVTLLIELILTKYSKKKKQFGVDSSKVSFLTVIQK